MKKKILCISDRRIVRMKIKISLILIMLRIINKNSQDGLILSNKVNSNNTNKIWIQNIYQMIIIINSSIIIINNSIMVKIIINRGNRIIKMMAINTRIIITIITTTSTTTITTTIITTTITTTTTTFKTITITLLTITKTTTMDTTITITTITTTTRITKNIFIIIIIIIIIMRTQMEDITAILLHIIIHGIRNSKISLETTTRIFECLSFKLSGNLICKFIQFLKKKTVSTRLATSTCNLNARNEYILKGNIKGNRNWWFKLIFVCVLNSYIEEIKSKNTLEERSKF